MKEKELTQTVFFIKIFIVTVVELFPILFSSDISSLLPVSEDYNFDMDFSCFIMLLSFLLIKNALFSDSGTRVLTDIFKSRQSQSSQSIPLSAIRCASNSLC